MLFKKIFLNKYKEKISKIKIKYNKEILNQKLEFSKILSHDVKTALLAQNNCLELIIEEKFGKITSLQKSILIETLSSNKFLVETINNALYLTNMEEKTSNLNFENVDIINQTKLCFKDIRQSLENKNQKIIFDTNKDQKININADKKLVQKIISNLILSSSSLGYEKSNIVVSIKENDSEISFKAKNKSIYMTKEKLENIFNDNQAENDFNQLGMKLNLNVAKKLICAHNWKFIATSDEKDKTSTFGFVVNKT